MISQTNTAVDTVGLTGFGYLTKYKLIPIVIIVYVILVFLSYNFMYSIQNLLFILFLKLLPVINRFLKRYFAKTMEDIKMKLAGLEDLVMGSTAITFGAVPCHRFQDIL